MYAAVIDCPEAWDGATVKFKTPQDYLYSLGRGLSLPPESEPRLFGAFDLLGQRPFAPGSPAGWPAAISAAKSRSRISCRSPRWAC